MPTISKGDTILVTGASGFIAVHVVKDLLQSGYKVRGTVRSEAKGEYLKELFKGQPFEYTLVDDITKDGIFDESVKGVDAVAHTASPFHFNASEPRDLIDPAYKGTTGILKSIQKNNPDVKRVVVTSSVASIMCTLSKKSPVRYTEQDWNVDSIAEVEKKGKDCAQQHWYRASKTKAERSLWDFIETEKPSWDAVTICPPLVLGEVLQQVEKLDNLNTSVAQFHAWASGSKSESDLPGPAGNWVGVKDVARAHVAALEESRASGQRFIVGAGPFTGQHIVDILHEKYPDLKHVPVGNVGSGDEAVKEMDVCVGTKATDVLGIQYQTLEEVVVEMAESLKKKQWL